MLISFWERCICAVLDFRYNPYVQARSRIDQLKRLGHSVDKVWSSYFFFLSLEYSESLKYCVDVLCMCNVLVLYVCLLFFQVEFILMGGTFMSLPADYRDYFIRNLHDALSGHTSANVEEAVAYSEHGATKCIGMTIET